MVRITIFILFAWLLASCVPGAVNVGLASVRQADPALMGLRPVVGAMLSGDANARLRLVQFLKTSCTTQDGLGGPPKCPPGKPAGSEVEVLPLGGPEGNFATLEAIGPVLEIPVQGLYAIYRVSVTSEAKPDWPEGEYALIFTRRTNDYPMPVIVRVTDGKIVRIDHVMGREPASLLEGLATENILLPPEVAAEWVKENVPPKGNPAP